MALDHEGVVLDALFRELEVSQGGSEEHACDYGGGGRSKTATKGDLVDDVDVDDGGGEGEVVGEEDVERHARDEVLVGIEGSFACAFAGVAEDDLARGGGGRSEGDVEGEVEREGEAEDVESGSDVGGRGWDADDPLLGELVSWRVSGERECMRTLRSPVGAVGATMMLDELAKVI